jgi:hypothetical protein
MLRTNLIERMRAMLFAPMLRSSTMRKSSLRDDLRNGSQSQW